LRSFRKYFFPFVIFLVASCGAKKKTIHQEDGTPAGSAAAIEVRFGSMFVDGCAERMKGNLQEALKLFIECNKLKPGTPAVAFEMGTIYKLLGRNDEAVQQARICATADPTNEWYQLLFVDCLNSKGKYAEAIKIRESLVKRFPERSDFKEDLAIEYAVTGQYERSYKLYEDLERAVGVNEQLTINKVKLLRSQKNLKEAEREFLKLIATDPREPRFYGLLAELYLDMNEPEKAKSMYDKIIEIDPSNATVNLALHDYHASRGEQEKAFAHLKLAFGNPELDVITKAGILGDFYRRAEVGDMQARQQGMELAKLMLGAHPDQPASNALYADFLMLGKDLQGALKHYYAAAVREAREPRIWENLLVLENELGRYDSLEKHAALAIEYFPSSPRNYLYRALACSRNGKPAEAARALEDGLPYVNDDKSLTMDFLRLMGDSYHATGQHEKSDKTFDDALKVNSDDAYVLNNYSYYLSVRKTKLELAERLSKKANELEPNNRNYMDTYGWILYQQGKYLESAVWLGKAAKYDPPNATILEHYGDALFRLGRTAEALKQWNAALNAGGDSVSLQKKIKDRKLAD
jgi:tetratricopeptide (TPR) repeat protein